MGNRELVEIVSTCNSWLKKDLPYSVKNKVTDVKTSCKSELLRNELISLGYTGIGEQSSIDINRLYCFKDHLDHKHIIHWTDKNEVSWLDDSYCNPIAEKFYVAITFLTGPYYISGGDTNGRYHKAKPFFNDIWKKIISYKPDSLDSHNHNAYFEIHRKEAISIWNEIDSIIGEARKSFDDLMKNDKEERIRLLEEQINKIKGE